jgi:predicted DNA helicase
MLERSDASELARGWIREAEGMKQRLRQREKRKATTWTERREVMTEVNGLYASAKRATRDAQRGILDGAAVIAVTAAGSESGQVAGQRFDRVVLDEATQAPDPIALVALQQAPAAVLAGDPHQLPPTVIGEEAERLGLSETFFERLAAGPFAGELVTLLRVQHRMHEALMAFPNAATYGGALRASPEVARALLTEVEGVREDPSRAGPFVLLDTVGRGWEEERTGDDPSTRNPGNAERVAAEVRRLVSRGVGAADIGVITPYQAQVREIRDRLSELVDAGLEVSSVDGFQGREKLVIVVDLVRSNDEGEIGFLRDVRRMNVALTRAKRWMMVLGDGALMARHRYYKGLLEHAETTDAWLSAWADEGESLEG